MKHIERRRAGRDWHTIVAGAVGGGVCVFLLSLPIAHAAHPLQTEDTGTQGDGNIELESGLSLLRRDSVRLFSFQPQISVGIGASFDLIVQPSWLSSRVAGAPAVQGWGDTNIDAKWRFYGATPWSLATRFGVGVATNQKGLGIERNTLAPHLVTVATYDAAPLAVHANLGVSHLPASGTQRENLFTVSTATMWSLNEHWILAGDLGAATNAERTGRTIVGSALVGVIWTIRPGLDADLGFQRTLGVRPATKTWLVGLTYRFAP